jgi:hypothetical protein
MTIQSVLTIRVLLNIREAAHTNKTYTGPQVSTPAFEMRPQTTVEGVSVPIDDDDPA